MPVDITLVKSRIIIPSGRYSVGFNVMVSTWDKKMDNPPKITTANP